MDENLTNKSLSAIDISSPGTSKQTGQTNNIDNTPLKRKKQLERNKETPKKKNVKRDTITGDEYQKILQILVRHRSLQTPGVKIGSEVSDISDLDDIVYLKGRTCKFFQIKHLSTLITTDHLFKTDFPLYESPQSPQQKKIKRSLHLALYFEAFVNIKEKSQFKNFDIEDVYFVTNSSLKVSNDDFYSKHLTKANSLENDKLLYLEGTRSKKYGLDVESVKALFYNYWKNLYRYNMKIEEMTNTHLKRLDELICEFISKIRIVMNFPDITTVRSETMKEIFGELDPDTRNIFEHCLIHMESELLRISDEYLTSKEWKSNIDRVESLIEKLKMMGITEYEKKKLTWKVGDLRLENTSINRMFIDLEMFLESPDYRVLHLHQTENVELTSVTVLNLLKCKNVTSDYYIYCTLEGLVSTDGLLNSFIQGKFKLLVIAYGNDNMNYDLKEIANAIENSDKSEKKYIFISQNEDFFKNYINIHNKSTYYMNKCYRNGFKVLDESSKTKILDKTITFQGKSTKLKVLFQNSRDFAEKVINESCLWEIVNPKSPCTVSNTKAFCSLGYDNDYYIPRMFVKGEGEEEEVKQSENTMVDLLGHEKIIVLVGNSGVGKSTVLTRIANLLSSKQQHKEIWFIRVNLRIFFSKNKLTTFGDVTKIECATEMAFKMAFPNEPNKLEERLFKGGLQEKKLKVVILLDGFNEVGSQTRNKVCAFVKTIQSIDSILQCWITTQDQNKEKLETNLNVSAYSLVPLSDEDQIDLLVKYWAVEYSRKSPPEHYEVSELKNDASSALNMWKECIFDENERAFTSVVLNLKMLADILLDRNRKLDRQISLLDLYNLFVEQKFSCYNRETSVNCNSCAKYEDLDLAKEHLFVHSVRKVLQYISAKSVIPKATPTDKNKQQKEFPGMTYDEFKNCVGDESEGYSKISLLKIGLLTLKNDDFELTHESYVQFFFSEYVVNYFSNNEVQRILMDLVLVKNSFKLCRRFINKLFSNHIKNKIGVSQRKNINQTKLSARAQASFMKNVQLKVVVEERLLNIMLVVSNKLTLPNHKAYVKNVVKYFLKSFSISLKYFADIPNIKNDLKSIENFNNLSILDIVQLLQDPNLFKQPIKSYDDARERVQTLKKASNNRVQFCF